MAEVERDETVRLEDDPRIGTFEGHSAFVRMSPHYLEESSPVGHNPAHDVTVRTAPAPFDRTNRDDVDRVQFELMVQLGGAVDDHCLGVVLEHRGTRVDDVAADELNSWIDGAALALRLETRTECGVDVFFDTELDYFVDQKVDVSDWYVDLGWTRCEVYGMARSASLAEPVYVVVAKQHILGLSSRAALFYSSHQLGSEEYLSAKCELAYAPRVDFHPGSVRIARVRFEDESQWRAAVEKKWAARRPVAGPL